MTSSPATAVVIPFPAMTRLTMKDRIEVLKLSDAARANGYDRLLIRDRHPEDDPQLGDFLAIYRRGEPWASWGVQRRGPALHVWRCATGADLGEFRTVEEALDAIVTAPAPEPRLKSRRA
ncbi:MAG: hypothetical protein JO047_02245 [Alphaproteobacteria bacterium]|nr:hypothetical protein [Alphaproteobacteria bacterium]